MYILLVLCFDIYILDLVYAMPAPESGNARTQTLDKDVFRMPRTLRARETIKVMGQMTPKKEKLTMNLVNGDENDKPDFNNVACQLKLEFPNKRSQKDIVTVSTIVDGVVNEATDGLKPSALFHNDTITVTFLMIDDYTIGIDVGDSSTTTDCAVAYGIDKIKFLTTGGDLLKVNSLNFALE